MIRSNKFHRHVRILSALGTLLILATVIFCGLQVSKLSTRYSIKQFYPKNHPTLALEDEFEKRFQLHNMPAFLAVLHVTKGDWLDQENLSQLKTLTTNLATTENVAAATSLGTIDIAVNKGSELRIGSLMDSVPPKEWKTTLKDFPLLKPQLISEDLKSALIVIDPTTPNTEKLGILRTAVQNKLNALPAGITSVVSGIPAMQIQLAEKLQKEVVDFFGLSLIIFVLMFAAFYRGISPVAFAAAGLVSCNTVVIGLLARAGVPFTVLLSTLPVIVSIAFMSITVHTLYLWADRLEEAGDRAFDPAERWKLSHKVMREIFLANLLGSATTAIGFAMLATAAIPAIRDFAIVVAGSVFVAFFVSQVLLFVGLAWVHPVQRSWLKSRAWWTLSITRRAVPIIGAVVVVGLLMSAAASQLNFSSPLYDDLPKVDGVRKAMMQIDEKFGGTVSLDYVLDSKVAKTFGQPEPLRQLRQAIREARAVEGVGSVIGVSDFITGEIPATDAGVAEDYFLYSLSQANPLKAFLDNDQQRARVAIRLRDLSSEKVDLVRSELRGIFAKHLPAANLSETGVAVAAHTVNRELARELVFGFWQSLVVIGLLLVFVFRSFRWALMACLPNLVPPAILAGALAITQTPVKPSVALIFSIALGLAFNNTVYLLTRLRRLQSEKNLSFLPLRRTLLEEGNPCLSESVLMFAGFLIFTVSDFQLNQTLGTYMVLSIIAGAIADLVFLPAVLKVFPDFLLKAGPITSRAQRKANVVAIGLPISTTNKEKAAVAAAVAACLIITFTSNPAGAVPKLTDEATALLNQVRANVESKSDDAEVVLKTTDPNGDVQSRDIRLKSMRDSEGYKALVRIEAPADIKGTALLAEVKNGNQDQWLYLPSTKQVRRIVSGKKSAGVLGSELSPEDLNADALKNATAKLTKKDASNAWVEVKPDAGSSEYSKVVVTVALDRKVPTSMDYYVGDKIKKKVVFSDYKQISGVQRAQKLVVENLQNKRSTEVTLRDLKVNGAIDAGDLTVAALKRGH